MCETCKLDSAESLAFCERIFDKVRGRAQIRINGRMPCFDRTRNEVFINDYERDEAAGIPAQSFLKNLSAYDIERLNALPDWDGSNEHLLSGTVLSAVQNAIRLYRK